MADRLLLSGIPSLILGRERPNWYDHGVRCFSAAGRCLAVFLALSVLCLPVCRPQACGHACCPSHSGNCPGGSVAPAQDCIRSAPLRLQGDVGGAELLLADVSLLGLHGRTISADNDPPTDRSGIIVFPLRPPLRI